MRSLHPCTDFHRIQPQAGSLPRTGHAVTRKDNHILFIPHIGNLTHASVLRQLQISTVSKTARSQNENCIKGFIHYTADMSGGQHTPETRYSCIYFGYGSNLSMRSMKQRCPDSLFVGLAVLPRWKWIINETGYANIIPGDNTDEVYGSLCFLSHRDEMALDESEGVPWLYEKMKLNVRRVLSPEEATEYGDEVPEVEAVCYVDTQRLAEGNIEKEYIVWIRKAIEVSTRG